jgi:hypothetical protein
MKPRKYLAIEPDVCAAYVAGERQRDIARRFGIPETSVNTIVRRAGVSRTRADTKRQRIIASFRPTVPARVIAEEIGCHAKYVYTVISECGLRGEAR